jgi:hypothetical protein
MAPAHVELRLNAEASKKLPDTRRPAGSSDLPSTVPLTVVLAITSTPLKTSFSSRIASYRVRKTGTAAAGDRRADFDETIRMLHADLPQEQRVHQAENRRVRADADCERQYGGRGKQWITTELPRAVPRVLDEPVPERACARISNVLLDDVAVTELDHRGATCRVRWHPSADFLVDEKRVEGCDLIVQIALDTGTMDQIAPETSKAGQHDPLPLFIALCFQGARNRECDLVPVGRFFAQLALPRFRELVILGAAVVLGRLPGRFEPARFFEAVQRRKERSGLHGKRPARNLLDAARHAQPVQLAGGQGFEDQEIQRPLQQRFPTVGHAALLLSTVYTRSSVPRFLSSVNRSRTARAWAHHPEAAGDGR